MCNISIWFTLLYLGHFSYCNDPLFYGGVCDEITIVFSAHVPQGGQALF